MLMCEPKPVILVVDDLETNREILADILRDDGYMVRTASNGAEALRMAACADVILLDMFMPGMDGLTVCRLLQANPQTEHIPVLFLSGCMNSCVRKLALEAGAHDFLEKPITATALRSKLAAARHMPQGLPTRQRHAAFILAVEQARETHEAIHVETHRAFYASAML